ncbi:hypothetical protein QRX50_17145 [Amycolatopsis carbonis]|uniref:Uncharacterized protein n=1 Tax=Amycolatopsis carbonis TaxID=715471 RepID=A0A9Y2N0V9_9PSEU|nr:hypothetical protein [Amycolatopsis sp. 2-15]WIX82362.1 hypothetical protein QRX50_17145 [Amycolatopsis sp. 2-15]
METITATYAHENDDWTITVSGRGEERTAKAPGIIAARDRADQLVDELAPDGRPTVVHLLNGSALEFTSSYMAARLTLPDIEPLEVPPSGSSKPAAAVAPAAAKPQLPPSKQLPKEVEDRKAEETPDVPTSKPTVSPRA